MHAYIWRLSRALGQFISFRSKNSPIGVYSTYQDELIEFTAKSADVINDIVKWSKQSDFSILQDGWRRLAIILDCTMDELGRRIEFSEPAV